MRNAALLMASLLLGSMALAGGKRATAQGPSEQFATAEGKDSTAVAAASDALAEQNESYRRTKRQRAKAGCDGWQRD